MSKFKDGDVCAICNKEWRKGLKFANHHVSYSKDITVVLCYGCHSLLHGSARTYRHPFAEYGKDYAPYIFARRVIEVYEQNKPASDETLRILREAGQEWDKTKALLGTWQIGMYLADINVGEKK